MDVKDGLATDKWYRALTYISVVVLVAVAAIPNDPILRRALLLMAAGGLLVGLGEWINHPYQVRLGVGFKISGYARRSTLVGGVLVVVGLLLVGRGVWLLW